MKKIYLLLGIILLIVATVIIGSSIYKDQEAAAYQETAVPYLKMVVPEISKWDHQTIKSYMPAETLERTSEENIIKIVKHLSRLGALKKMAEPNFSKLFSHKPAEGESRTIVTYTVDAVYEHDDAIITISLLDKGDYFKVSKFDIDAEILKK